jgi:hypothetical protein
MYDTRERTPPTPADCIFEAEKPTDHTETDKRALTQTALVTAMSDLDFETHQR